MGARNTSFNAVAGVGRIGHSPRLFTWIEPALRTEFFPKLKTLARHKDAWLARRSWLLAVFCAIIAGIGPAAAGTLQGVKSRGELSCGVSDRFPGLAVTEGSGVWRGLEVDFCRAVAAAVLGSASKAVIKPFPHSAGFRALASGEIDLLVQNASWTLSRDTEFKIHFVGMLLHDGQGFLVPRSLGLSSALELSGATICVVSGTRAEEALAGFFARNRMRYRVIASVDMNDLVTAYKAGSCMALTGDVTRLAAVRNSIGSKDAHLILPEFITKEPLGPAVRAGDEDWFAIVRWVLMALIKAEELGVDSSNVNAKSGSPMDDVRRLLGSGSNLGQTLGLEADWVRSILRSVGNYGEIYERNLGAGSPFQLDRGYNKLWSRGGLMYAAPLR